MSAQAAASFGYQSHISKNLHCWEEDEKKKKED